MALDVRPSRARRNARAQHDVSSPPHRARGRRGERTVGATRGTPACAHHRAHRPAGRRATRVPRLHGTAVRCGGLVLLIASVNVGVDAVGARRCATTRDGAAHRARRRPVATRQAAAHGEPAAVPHRGVRRHGRRVVCDAVRSSAFRFRAAQSLSLELSPDPRVFVFALGVSLVTGIVFGLAPALQGASKDITSRLRNDSAASSARRSFAEQRAHRRSARALARAARRRRAVHARARPWRSHRPWLRSVGRRDGHVQHAIVGLRSRRRRRAFYRALRERVAALPGVTAVSYTGVLPLTMSSDRQSIDPNGAAARQKIGVRACEVSSPVRRRRLLRRRAHSHSRSAERSSRAMTRRRRRS